MKKNVLSRAFSLFLALLMVLGTVPVTVISAYAEAAPEMLVTSLTELYSGDETRAREDLEALSAAGLLGADGKLVALDIRENGESIALSALAERIANGESVGEITVNGNAATPEQIVQIQSVQAAIEIAELLDEDIDVTDEHVENLEGLLTGIQNGNVDLENALKTGALTLKSSGNALLGAGNEITQYATTRWSELPTELTLTEDGTSFIGPYISGSTYDPNHAFFFESGLSEFVDGYTGANNKTDDVVTDSNTRRNMFDWDKAIVGVETADSMHPIVTVLLPLLEDDAVQNQIASDADEGKLLDITDNGVGLKMELPVYGEVSLRYVFRYMYFSINDRTGYGSNLRGQDPRYPVYLVESEVNGETRVTAVATRFTAPGNAGENVRRDALSLFVNPRGSATDDEYTSEKYEEEQHRRKDHRLLPENWSDFFVDANGLRYYSPKEVFDAEYARLRAIKDAAYDHMQEVDFVDYGPAYAEYTAAINAWSDYYDEGTASFTTAIAGRCLPYYVAPAFLISGSKYIERPEGSWEPAEAGFIKLKNPENPDFPYVYPKDIENPQNQYDAELMYTEDFYQVYAQGYTRMGEDVDLRIALRISNRLNFYVPEGVLSWRWYGFLTTETDGGRGVTVMPNEITNQAAMHAEAKPFGGDSYDRAFALGPRDVQIKIKDAEAFLLIPSSSRLRETMMRLDTDVPFSSNIAQHNKRTTVFKAELYKIRDDQMNIAEPSIPEDAVKIEVPNWGDYPSPVVDPVTEYKEYVNGITVPGTALDTAGTYAVRISAEFTDGEQAQTISAIAYLKAKQIPTTVKIDRLTSTYANKDNVPSVTYSLEDNVPDAQVKYTIQQAGSSAIAEYTGSASGGTITIPEVSFEGLKTAFTITVYARNSEEDPWSMDSVLITVYNNDILDILIKDVAFGELEVSTGGLPGNGTEVASGNTFNLDNKDKIEALLDQSGEGAGFAITVDDLLSLRSDVGLLRAISANYGNGTWGAISDRMQWTYTDANGKTSGGVTLNNKENGAYTDLTSRSHTSYIPSTDFIVAATDDRSADAPVTITATHANSGVTRSFQVTVNTLRDRFYMFRFLPKATTYVSYTNGDGVKRTLHSNAAGELAVYEPSGIASDILTMSEVDGETYAGTYFQKDLVSGERNLAKAELYPCNNLKLLPISSQTVTILKPDGTPYSGKVTLRAGVYKGGVYCPTVGVRASEEESDPILREDVILTAADGKITLYYDPTQLTADNGLSRGLKYVYEYRIDGYQPGYVIVNPVGSNAADAIVTLQNIRGSAATPQITRQEYQQYLNGRTPTSYIRNVIDYTENIGISPNFTKSVLYTDIALPGETVGVDANGYASYTGDIAVSFAFYTTDGKKLTGQTELTAAKTITNLKELNSATYFVFPFSAVPMLRSTYVMTDADMRADGIDDTANTPTARIKAVFTRGALTVANLSMPFGITNVSHQPNLSDKNDGAKAVGIEVRNNLKETTDIGAIFRSINVNDMIRKGFVFLGNLAGAGGDNPISLMILPTQDPAAFRIIAFVGANQRGGDEDGVSVNFNSKDLAEDMSKFKKEMEEMDKKKDDEKDSGGEGSMQFNFYGTIILEARAGVADGKWNIAFRGGNVGTNVKGKYEWGQTFMCGPYPAFISFEVGFHADLEVAFGNKAAARAMLLDAALGVSVEAFAGLGFDLSIVALQLGIYGQIGADVNFLLLTPSNESVKTGTKLTISGEIGIKLKIKLLFISYSKKFASTGFNWTKKWNQYDQIKNYWTNQGFGQLFGTTRSGRNYAMYLFADGSAMVAIDGGPELESRDYLELEQRVWTGGAANGMRLMRAAGAMTDVQTNAYPYSHPAFTDDGELFLYISDNDNADNVDSVASYAVKNGSGYDNAGRVDTSEDNVLADLDIVASGTRDNAFAAWVKQVETPKTEKDAEVTNDDLSMMFNATEVYAASYNGMAWTTTRLTDNSVADMSPTVASSGSKAIVAWRSMNASTLSDTSYYFDGKLISENFNDSALPNGWTGNVYVSDNALYLYGSSGYAYLPAVDLSTFSNPRLTFSYKTVREQDDDRFYQDNLQVQYSEDGGETWNDLTGAMISDDWSPVNLELPKKNVQIRFSVSQADGAYSGNSVYIDNVALTVDPIGEPTDTLDEVRDITSMFDVENNINYRIYDGATWKEAQIAYNGSAGTVNAIDSAMLPDGTALLTYTVRTGEDVTTTETFYTVIGSDGAILTTGRLTNDSYTDTNAQVTAVNENGGYFVLGWYSEHDAGEGNTKEYDDNGNATDKAVVAHDIRLARINANGSYAIDFPESIGGTGDTGISSDFHFSAPANNTKLTNVALVWSQRKESDKADDAGKYELNAVRFFEIGGMTGMTAPANMAETAKNYTVDHFDVYTDGDGAVHIILLGSDYNSIQGISVYDSIDLDAAAGNTVSNNDDSPKNLDILDGEAISSMKLAVGTFPVLAADVTADMDIDEVIPGFSMPVQFTVTNTGTGKLDAVTAKVGSQSKDFTGLNLLPTQSATLLMTYDVPEGTVSDVAYSVTGDGVELGSGTLTLNRPDVGISGMKLVREENGERDVQVMLSNNSAIPLAGSGKTVKLAFYKDPFHETMIGEAVSLPAEDYADIDQGIFTTVQTIDVTQLFTGDEIPEAGLTVYARAWVEDTEEPDNYNNDSFISFTGLLARNNGEKLTVDSALEVNDGSYTVYAELRNNSMQAMNAGIPVAVLLDSNGNIIAQKNFRDTELEMGKESRCSDLSVTFTADEIKGTPVEASVRRIVKVSFDVNGGTGEIAEVATDLNGRITIPEATPAAPEKNPPVFFRGWYTAPTGGELVTEETFFNEKTTVYAQYTEHRHVFQYSVSDSGDTIIAKCVSTVNDTCPLEEQDRTATLTITAPEREATGYGMPEATITGAKEVLGSPKVSYYLANETGTDKTGEALAKAPLNAGKYWAEATVADGANRTTIHVVYDIPVIEGLTFSEATIHEYVRAENPAAMNGLTGGDPVEALAWIYANEDMLRPSDWWDENPRYIVYAKRYMPRPEDFPEELEWLYDDNTEYAFCYCYSLYDCERETIPASEVQTMIASGSNKVYIPGTGSMELQTDAAFISINNREELSGGMNPCTELDALLWILKNGKKYQKGGFIMLSQRNEDECSSIEFRPGFARVQSSDLDMVFDMHEGEGMPIFVRQISNVLNPNTSYTVTFDANGGEGSVSGGGKYYVKSKIELPGGDGLTKPNLVFDGWNTRADGSGDDYKPGDKFEVLENTTFFAQWKHVHHWTVTYNEGTHVYTATCGVWGCPNSTLTLHPEAVDTVYNGENAKPYACSAQWTEENGLPIPTVTYFVGGQAVPEAKNVGTYTALVSLDGHENIVGEFQITPRPVTVTADDLSKHEGEEEPALTVSYAPVGASLRFENDETYPWKVVTEGDRVYAKSGNGGKGDTTSTLTLKATLSEPGTISFDYTSQGEGSNWDVSRFYIDDVQKFQYGEGPYDWQTCSYDLSAGTHTLSWAYSKDGGTDNSGDCFTVDNVVITTEGEVTQAAIEEKPDDTVPFQCLVADLRFKNDASYPWAEVTEDDRTFVKSGNAGAGDTTSTLTLNVTLAEAGKVSFDYKYGTEEGCDRCYFNVDGNDLFEESGQANWQSYATKLSAGSHALTWRYTKDGSVDHNGDFFAIDNLVFTTEGEVKQEDPSLALIPALNKFEGGIVEGETLHYTIARAPGETMGTYAITVTMGDNPNYDVREVTGGTFTILESLGEMQTITADDVTATYGDTGLKINATLTEGDGTLSYEVKSGDAVTVDAEGNLTIVKAGTAVISVVASKTDTYARTTKSVNVTINPKAMTVSTGNVNATANGHPVGITVTVTDPAEGYTVKYGTAEGTYNLSASPTLTEAGTMTVYYQVTADNYETFTGSATLTLVNHSHEMTYTAGTGENANTITAVCSGADCPLPNRTATLTISGPEAISVYDGAAHPALITDENGIRGDAKVLYAAKGENGTYGIATETAPVDAGTYKASITLGTGEGAVTVSVEYVIISAELANVSAAQNGTLTYTGDAQTPQVTTAAKAVNNQPVTFTYSKTENGTYGAMPTFTDVADAGTVYFKATAPNHKPATGSFTVTMGKADRPAPAAPTLRTAAANAITLTAAEGCQYSMDGVTWQDEATFTGLQKNTEYTFYQRLKATGNYNASPASEAATLSTTDHDHQWSFQGTGATITATCGNTDGGHGTPLTAALTINAPALTTYGETGKSANATITGSIDGVDTPAVVYRQGGTALTATPTDAGTYTASITVGTATASVEYTIAKATMTDVSVAQTGTMTYTGSAQTPQVAAAATVANNQPVTFTYSLTENGEYGDMPSFTTVADAGTVYFKATAPNHEPATGSFTVTMNKANQTAPAAPTKADATINSITLTAIANGEYSKDGNTWQESATFTGLTMNTEYTFYQRLKADDNHNASPVSQSASIRTSNHAHEWVFTAQGAVITATCGNGDKGHSGELSATMTITAPTLTVYGGTGSANVTVTNGIAGVGIPSVVYKQGETVLAATPTDAGTYTASITVGTATASVTYTIAKKAVTVTADHKSKTYGESDPAFTATNTDLVGSDTLNYTLSRAEGENAGEYTISVVPGENPNYEVTTVGAKLTINKKAATVTAESKTKTYGDADPVLTATATDLVGSDTLNYTLSRAGGENVGEYAITVTPGENPNYEVTTVGAKLTINKKAATVTADSKTKIYGDANPALTATVEGTVGTDTLNYTLSRAEGENVGDYTITVTLGDNPNYNVTAANSTFTITKKAASVTAVNTGKIFQESEPALTATVEGTVGTDALNYTLSRAKGEEAGEYTISVALGNNPNYDVTAIDGVFTVAKKAATITVANLSKVYGENDPALTATVEGTVGEDTLDYTLSRAQGNNAGEYVITATPGNNPNYDVTVLNGIFTILKKSADVVITPHNAGKVYGEADPGLSATVTGLVGDDTLRYTLSRDGGEDAGEYSITVHLGENPNYEVATLRGIFTISKKSVTITADNLSKVFGEDDPALTATAANVVGGDTLNYTLSRAEGENAGEYRITVHPGNNPNYDVTVVGGKLTITKAAPAPAALTEEKIVYNGTKQALVSLAGTVTGGRVMYALSASALAAPEEGWSTEIPQQTSAGTYYVWYKVMGDENHTDAEPVCVEVTIAADYGVASVNGLSGANEDQWTKSSDNGLAITMKPSGEEDILAHFVGVKLDGNELVRDVDYTIEEDGSGVTLQPETLAALAPGKHTVTIVYDNGEAETTFTVSADSHVGLWIAVAAVSVAAMVVIILFVRKRKAKKQ